jgi:hypothetical protein
MGPSQCEACLDSPVMKCGRCTTTRCKAHALGESQRCDRCERDWQDEAPTRRAAKMIFAPPVAIFSGGLLFGLLVPVSLVGVAIMAMVALVAAVGAGAGACRVVDRSARALFLRERSGGLPPARLLPSRSGR